MHIDWAAFGSVFVVSVLTTAGLVGAFTVGIMGLSRQEAAAKQGAGAAPVARAGAYACFALCAAGVGYGVYLIAG
jgi:hypothetical protein